MHGCKPKYDVVIIKSQHIFTFYHCRLPVKIIHLSFNMQSLPFSTSYTHCPVFHPVAAAGSCQCSITFHHHQRNPLVNTVNAGWPPAPGLGPWITGGKAGHWKDESLYCVTVHWHKPGQEQKVGPGIWTRGSKWGEKGSRNKLMVWLILTAPWHTG